MAVFGKNIIVFGKMELFLGILSRFWENLIVFGKFLGKLICFWEKFKLLSDGE